MGDLDSIPGLGRSPGEANNYPWLYSNQDNSMHCIVHGVTKSWTWLSDFHFQKNDSYFFKSLFFNWRIIPLQGCVAFCSTMWFSHKYIYVPSLWSALPTESHPTPLGSHRAPDWASYVIFKWRTKINIHLYIFNKMWGIMIFIICRVFAVDYVKFTRHCAKFTEHCAEYLIFVLNLTTAYSIVCILTPSLRNSLRKHRNIKRSRKKICKI